jgi:hypothetical protein
MPAPPSPKLAQAPSKDINKHFDVLTKVPKDVPVDVEEAVKSDGTVKEEDASGAHPTGLALQSSVAAGLIDGECCSVHDSCMSVALLGALLYFCLDPYCTLLESAAHPEG